MSLEAAIDARLAAAGLNVPADRIVWGRRLKGLPSLAMQIVADPRPQHMRGLQAFRQTQVQIDIMAAAHGAAVELREAVIAALLPPAAIDGVRFLRGQVLNVRSTSPQEASNTTPRLQAEIYRESIDFLFFHNA